MGHIHSDTVEEAWRDLSKAAVLAQEGQVFGATNQVRLLLRDIRGTAGNVALSYLNSDIFSLARSSV